MKCVCGYEYEEEWNKEVGEYKTIKGNKEFIDIEGHFTITKKHDYYSDETKKISLFACPECGIVKINLDWI